MIQLVGQAGKEETEDGRMLGKSRSHKQLTRNVYRDTLAKQVWKAARRLLGANGESR